MKPFALRNTSNYNIDFFWSRSCQYCEKSRKRSKSKNSAYVWFQNLHWFFLYLIISLLPRCLNVIFYMQGTLFRYHNVQHIFIFCTQVLIYKRSFGIEVWENFSYSLLIIILFEGCLDQTIFWSVRAKLQTFNIYCRIMNQTFWPSLLKNSARSPSFQKKT